MKHKIIIITISFDLVLFIAGCSKTEPIADYDHFVKCLTAKGIKLYGTEWCGHCRQQKKLFGDSVEYLNFIDCDKNAKECKEAGIKAYPTWVIDGKNYLRQFDITTLAGMSKCDLKIEN